MRAQPLLCVHICVHNRFYVCTYVCTTAFMCAHMCAQTNFLCTHIFCVNRCVHTCAFVLTFLCTHCAHTKKIEHKIHVCTKLNRPIPNKSNSFYFDIFYKFDLFLKIFHLKQSCIISILGFLIVLIA